MNAPTLETTRQEIAARLNMNVAELTRLCRVARHAGWRTEADQLGAVVVAAHAVPGARGPAARSEIEAAIRRAGPLRLDWIQGCVAAAVARVDGCRWQAMWCPDPAPGSAAELARGMARAEAHRRFPGRSRSAESKRRRHVLKMCGPLRAKKNGNGGGAA